MTSVHIITDGFSSPNGCAFLYPIIMHRRLLASLGLKISISRDRSASIPECNILMLDSKRFRDGWGENGHATLALFEQYRKKTDRLIFVDNTDSAGWINGQALSGADVYTKSMILRDPKIYLTPLHGRRVYTDYYHARDGVSDANPENQPQVTDQTDLNKIRVHWNSGLADYSLYGPALMTAYHHLHLAPLLRRPRGFTSPQTPREIEVSCRMGINYSRPSVAHQRKLIRQILRSRLLTEKLGRRAYLHELSRSLVVVSPFGLGEITLKDFETFIAGSTLLKPDMSQVQTWPDFFRANETMLVHKWDLSDLEDVIEKALADPEACSAIAIRAQNLYRHYLNERGGAEEFCNRFCEITGHKAS